MYYIVPIKCIVKTPSLTWGPGYNRYIFQNRFSVLIQAMYVLMYLGNTWDPNHMGLRAENYINLGKKVMLLL